MELGSVDNAEPMISTISPPYIHGPFIPHIRSSSLAKQPPTENLSCHRIAL